MGLIRDGEVASMSSFLCDVAALFPLQTHPLSRLTVHLFHFCASRSRHVHSCACACVRVCVCDSIFKTSHHFLPTKIADSFVESQRCKHIPLT